MRDAELRFAGSSERAGAACRILGVSLPFAASLAALAAIVLGFSLFAGSAGAATIHVPDTTFQLQTPGQAGAIAIDEDLGYVYVMHLGCCEAEGDIERFDLAGNPVNFPDKPGRNESQTIKLEGFAAGDKYTLTCPNGETTGEITWTGNFETVQSNLKTALEAKCGSGNFSVSGGPEYVTVGFQGAFTETNVPKMNCTTTSGASPCSIYSETDGAAELNIIDTTCTSSCMDITVDNTGGENQSTIYVTTTGGQETCCNPEGPNEESGGVHVYLPTGQRVGVIHTRYQDAKTGFGSTRIGTRSCGVAVDDDGNLIVAHGESIPFSYFDKLELSDWGTSPDLDPPILGTIASDHANPCRSDVDSEGNVYDTAGNSPEASGPLRKYPANAFEPDPNPARDQFNQPSQVPSQTLALGNHVDLALDEEGNAITFLTNGELRKWSTENGSPIEAFDTALISPGGVTRANSVGNGTLYVTDRSFEPTAKDVHIFKSLVVPDSVTGAFDPVTAATGVVDGDLDPAGGGEVLSCKFEVVNDAKFQATAFSEATLIPCKEGGTFSAPAGVSADVSGLTLEELHHFRLRTTNANGASLGSIHRFTPHAVINIATKAATNVAPRSATLNASFQGNGEAVEYWFEYGESAGYGNETAHLTAGSPAAAKDVSQLLDGLNLESGYHYRVVMKNAVGTSRGEDQSFTTRPAVTNLQTKPATSLDQDSVTLNGEFDGDGIETTYYFEYGFDTAYGSTTPLKSAGVTSGPTPVEAELEEFNGFRTYHYRVVAENSFGKTIGPDQTVTAPDPLEPGVQSTRIVSVTPTTATVSTEINPNHAATIYLFEWGETDNYGFALPFSDPIGGLDNENIPVSTEITGLKPGSVYHLRAVALNFKGTTEGEDIVLITPDVPRIDSTFANATGQTTAHLGGKIAAMASSTSVSFEYGPSASYGQSTTATAIGSDLFPRDVGADVGGLAPGTEYHFRIVATNGIGTTFGPDGTFTTAGSAAKEPNRNCARLAQQAKKASKSAKLLGKQARGAQGERAAVLRKRSAGFAKKARKKNKQAKACRSASRGDGK